jgi:hypothetical protein
MHGERRLAIRATLHTHENRADELESSGLGENVRRISASKRGERLRDPLIQPLMGVKALRTARLLHHTRNNERKRVEVGVQRHAS